MNEYIVGLEREFSLTENGFKLEESRALSRSEEHTSELQSR